MPREEEERAPGSRGLSGRKGPPPPTAARTRVGAFQAKGQTTPEAEASLPRFPLCTQPGVSCRWRRGRKARPWGGGRRRGRGLPRSPPAGFLRGQCGSLSGAARRLVPYLCSPASSGRRAGVREETGPPGAGRGRAGRSRALSREPTPPARPQGPRKCSRRTGQRDRGLARTAGPEGQSWALARLLEQRWGKRAPWDPACIPVFIHWIHSFISHDPLSERPGHPPQP